MEQRQARPEDVDEICRALPQTWFGTSWGDVPTWLVPLKATSGAGGDKGRGFVLHRKPHKTATDPETGEELPQPQFENVAVAPDGTVYVTVEANLSATLGVIAVSKSRDGGRTWSTSTLPGSAGIVKVAAPSGL